MKKKILITSTDVMMLQFLVPHVFYLQNQGYEVEVACSNVENHVDELKDIFKTKVKMHLVELKRNPMQISNIRGLLQLMKIIKAGSYDIIWTNEPVMGIMTRLAARIVRRKKVKIIYVAHGFHFYKGAPKKNWIVYYPIEKIFSLFTDEIVTINNEDYNFARQNFTSAKVVKLAHEIDPEMMVGMMLAYRAPYAYSCDPDDQIKRLDEMHQMLWYADVQAGGYYPQYILKQYERNNIVLEDEDEDYKLIKKYCVD